jgi:acylphosphatase
MLECRKVYFSGRVQGVGFRQSVVELSRRLPISGEVRNLPDGRVELVMQGTASDCQCLLDLLAKRYSGYISRTVEEAAPPIKVTGRIVIVR